MSLLADLINIRFLLIDGVKQVRRQGLNLIGVTAVDNEDENRTDITLMSGTTTTAPYTQPAVGATVDVAVTSSAILVAGMVVLVATGGYYSVSSVLGATSVRLLLLRTIAAVGATVATSKTVVASGTPSNPLLVAATVYVDGTNGTAAGVRGDASAPFATITQGLAALLTGDTLHVRPGTYSEQVTIPNLASVHIVLDSAVSITSSEAATIVRNSATALTSLVIDGNGASVANTHVAGSTIYLDGSSVATPGYDWIEIRNLRVSQTNTANPSLYARCIKQLYTEAVKCASRVETVQVGVCTHRNLDLAKAYAFAAGFDTGATLPTGFAGPGTLHMYSAKLGAVSLTGSLTATWDASCETLDFVSARSAGDLSTGLLHVDDLTVSDTGTATRSDLNVMVAGNAVIDAETDLTGTIRGDLTLTAANATVRGNIVGTVNETGAGIATLYETSALVDRISAVESGTGAASWIAITGYTAAPASDTTITMGTDYTASIFPGDAVRWQSSAGGYGYGVVSAVAAGLLTLRCPMLDDDAGATITGLWYGEPWRVVPILVNLPGPYAEADSTTALWDYASVKYPWLSKQSSIAWFAGVPKTVNAGAKPNFNVLVNGALASSDNTNAGPAVTAAGTLAEAVKLVRANCEIEMGEYLEIKITQSAASADDANLTVAAQAVIH